MIAAPDRFLLARRALAASSVVLAGWIASSNSQAQTWLGPVGNGGYWSTSSNWVGGVAPTNDGTANVVFSESSDSTASVLDMNWNVASVLFNTTPGEGASGGVEAQGVITAYSLGTTTLTVQQGITNNDTGAITIVPTIDVAQTQTWNTGSGGLIVNGITGAGGINKTGSVRTEHLGRHGQRAKWRQPGTQQQHGDTERRRTELRL